MGPNRKNKSSSRYLIHQMFSTKYYSPAKVPQLLILKKHLLTNNVSDSNKTVLKRNIYGTAIIDNMYHC